MKTPWRRTWLAVSLAAVGAWLQTNTPALADTPPGAAPAAGSASQPITTTELKVTEVDRMPESFAPTAGQSVMIQYRLTADANVTLRIYGPERELIRTLLERAERKQGVHRETWDGRDAGGRIVPDEAYFFVIEAAAGESHAVYDPLLTSGGERLIAYELRYDRDTQMLSYVLPRAGRVLVRAGLPEGPLVATVANWVPRPKGVAREPWNGTDPDAQHAQADLADCRLAVSAYALPEHSLLTQGNRDLNYHDYYLKFAADRPKAEGSVRRPEDTSVLSMQWTLPVYAAHDPTLTLEFLGPASVAARRAVEGPPSTQPAPASPPATQPGAPELTTSQPTARPVPLPLRGDRELIRVDIPDPAEREFMTNQRFEVVIYVDGRRVIEAEQGNVPFTYPWDISGLAAGRHLLTVNVAGFRNHVGSASRVVEILP